MLVQHPKFLSFVTSAVSPYSLAGAILSDIYNLNSGGFENAPTASIIEDKLINGWGLWQALMIHAVVFLHLEDHWPILVAVWPQE